MLTIVRLNLSAQNPSMLQNPHRFQPLAYVLFTFVSLVLTFTSDVHGDSAFGERTSFNAGWKFSKGEIENASSQEFDDQNWQSVTLPHDWAIAGPFEPRFNARNGGLPFHGTGWYRKSFTLPQDASGKVVSVAFDGAMYNAHVYINGQFLGNRPFGYVGFQFDLTPHLRFGNDRPNVIAVKLAPEDLSTRWYPGAGIYRNTWLEINNQVHVAQWGTYVTTPEITDSNATVNVRTTVENSSDKDVKATVKTAIHDATGNIVAELSTARSCSASAQTETAQKLTVPNPKRWDIDSPYLYQIVTQIIVGTETVDTYRTPLGIRTVQFKADAGFFLNGRHVPIQGVCLHHDNGPLGAVANRRAIQRKLEIMRSMGVNSVRTSHNPPSPELVAESDQQGIVLQVEAFDVWKKHKQMVSIATIRR